MSTRSRAVAGILSVLLAGAGGSASAAKPKHDVTGLRVRAR